MLLLLIVCAIGAAACSTWGAGHEADAALELDLEDPDRGILTPLERDLEPNERFWVRLELGAPTEADHIIVRFELDVGGRSYQEVEDYRFDDDLIPPWNVAAIPLSIAFTGDWNIAFIVNSRKVSDVRVRVEHGSRPEAAQTGRGVE